MKSFIRNAVAGGLIAAIALIHVPAYAQDAGFYVGGSIGQSKTKNDDAAFTALGATVTKNDERNSMFRLFAGYDINKYFAVEAAYVDLGAFGVSGTIGAAPFSAFGDINGFSASGVGTLPLSEKFSLFGSVGVFLSKVKASATVATVAGAARDHGTDVTAGAGIKYALSKNTAVRLEVNHYGLDDNGSAVTYSVGLQYKF